MAEAKRKRPPARTPQAREQQLVALAVDLAEKQIAAGTASAQVITHFLKLGSERDKLEREKLSRENTLLKAKSDAIASQQRVDQLYVEAMTAFKHYHGEELGDEEV